MTIRDRQKEKLESKRLSVIGALTEVMMTKENKNVCISILDGCFLGTGKAEMLLRSNLNCFGSVVLKTIETEKCVYIYI